MSNSATYGSTSLGLHEQNSQFLPKATQKPPLVPKISFLNESYCVSFSLRCNKPSPSSPLPFREASDARQEKELAQLLHDETAPLPSARADQFGGHEETAEVRTLVVLGDKCTPSRGSMDM